MNNTSPLSHQGTALVIGGAGFVAGFIVARLRQNGWVVRRGVRKGTGRDGAFREDEVLCELRDHMTPESWHPLLEGVDAVVNAAGIMNEGGKQTFDMVHYRAPLALAQACEELGISRFVQISAAGNPEDGEFIASKHKFDEILTQMEMDAVILRPAVVYSTTGSYGATSLLRALAGFPWFSMLPGHSDQAIQPVAAEDLGRIAAEAVDRGRDGIYEIGAQEPIELRQYQRQWRHWLKIPGQQEIELPEGLVNAQVKTWELFQSGPLGQTMWKLMRRGNTLGNDAWARVQDAFGFAPRSVAQVLDSEPSQVQDRWHAQLYFLAPTLKFALVAVLLLAAITNLLGSDALATALSIQLGLPNLVADLATQIYGTMELALAAWLGFSKHPRKPIFWIGMLIFAQTLTLAFTMPDTWLHPLGGMAKNLMMLPALGILWVLSDRR
jgi:uncharacterized protein YbjT (DUF2867 family)